MSLWTNGSSEDLHTGTLPDPGSSNLTRVQVWDRVRAVWVGLVLASLITVAIVGNILVIVAVVTHRRLRTPTNFLIINLAIADLLLATAVLPVSASLEVLGVWTWGRVLCDVWAALDVLCCTASILSLCVISVERYVGVAYPLRYRTLATPRRALVAMATVWALAVVVSIGPLLGWKQPPSQDDSECRITEEPFYVLFSSCVSFYVPLAVVLVMYARVYVVVRRTTRSLEAGVVEHRDLALRVHRPRAAGGGASGGGASGGGASGGGASLSLRLLSFSREKKAAKTLGVVVGMFVLCWLPFFLVLPLGSFLVSLRPPEIFFKVIFWLGYFNSCMNPVIYPSTSKEYYQAFITILTCRWGRKSSARLRPSPCHR